jgi:hypothetical protein
MRVVLRDHEKFISQSQAAPAGPCFNTLPVPQQAIRGFDLA